MLCKHLRRVDFDDLRHKLSLQGSFYRHRTTLCHAARSSYTSCRGSRPDLRHGNASLRKREATEPFVGLR